MKAGSLIRWFLIIPSLSEASSDYVLRVPSLHIGGENGALVDSICPKKVIDPNRSYDLIRLHLPLHKL